MKTIAQKKPTIPNKTAKPPLPKRKKSDNFQRNLTLKPWVKPTSMKTPMAMIPIMINDPMKPSHPRIVPPVSRLKQQQPFNRDIASSCMGFFVNNYSLNDRVICKVTSEYSLSLFKNRELFSSYVNFSTIKR